MDGYTATDCRTPGPDRPAGSQFIDRRRTAGLYKTGRLFPGRLPTGVYPLPALTESAAGEAKTRRGSRSGSFERRSGAGEKFTGRYGAKGIEGAAAAARAGTDRGHQADPRRYRCADRSAPGDDTGESAPAGAGAVGRRDRDHQTRSREGAERCSENHGKAR